MIRVNAEVPIVEFREERLTLSKKNTRWLTPTFSDSK